MPKTGAVPMMTAAHRRVPPPDSDPWYGRQDAAAYLGVAPRTLDHYTQTGRVKVGHTPGGQRRWRRSALDAVLADEDSAA
jgi:helix-turn-helix protein